MAPTSVQEKAYGLRKDATGAADVAEPCSQGSLGKPGRQRFIEFEADQRLLVDHRQANGLDLWQSARLFGLLDMALADGYIDSFDTKYTYAFWRPITAIRTADSDGNPRTSADPTWTPLRPTPPIPYYDSAHSVEGGAAAAVLRGYFGTDRISFGTCSLTLPVGDRCGDPDPVVRRYSSPSEAASENGVSRILIGFHFRTAVATGIQHGSRIGAQAVAGFLQPVR